ncbi:MAG: FtsX-like permease family protein [Desulfobacter postgatei]|uniref:ABC-type transport system, involved in lipoprotein release, permease component n=1 Tax=Desulfobacter postgatei 2ac9 TaxID=879212 RepID=I5AZ43_9BACT|nr:FtsX-like permease family protein [Desulfobacter postgatei]EIM62506.1 ABC-type transport system, involved in lipoprotein release, permease component [Desulfobacter postgatei 2ac9]MDD4273902.1 FtsX-like permease family protein [Desulfobacter postgatei]
MLNIFKLAMRNLRRYQRRTLLTSVLISLGVVAVLLFISVSGSFKALMIGQITDSMLGHLQVHQKGYLASIDSLPLDRNLQEKQIAKVKEILDQNRAIESYSMRIKLGAMFSNFTETTNLRLNAVNPEQELRTVPMLTERIIKGKKEGLLAKGEILVPELIAKGMNVNIGDTIVLVATNKEGSVNGQPFIVRGVLEGISGPGGRDGIIHLQDAKSLLRIEGNEISEIAIRLQDIKFMDRIFADLQGQLGPIKNKMDKPVFEVHTWQKLSPFFNIARMIDLMTLFIKTMLVAIVLVSIMNVMIMAVYERINEIGTIAAIGTVPNKILSLFVMEGFLLGVFGTLIGVIISLVSIATMNASQISFDFGRQKGLLLSPTIAAGDVITVCVIVVAIAVLASLQPAWKAAKMDPITALRHV